MNIAIDVLGILSPDSKNRGIGNYTTNQLKALFQLDKSNRYFLLNFYENTSLKPLLNYSENVTEHYFYLGQDNFLSRDNQFINVFGQLIKKFIKDNQIDVFYFTSIFDINMNYDLEWFGDVKLFSTLYDIIPYIFKDRYLNSKEMLRLYLSWVEKIKKMDTVLAISQSAKDDLIRCFNVDSKRINVIYAGVDDSFRKLDLSEKEKEQIRARYNISGPFIMCPAGDDERKNIAGMIEAYSKIPGHLISQYQLVIVCKLSPGSMESYKNIARKHKVEDRVIFTNFVPLDDLVKLYNMAHIVAFPSKYEGFGLPVVEAMACGTPVLTSNNSSLGEIAIDAAVLVDPFNVKDIAKGLTDILEKSNQEELIQRGFERVKQFSWSDVASKTLAAFMQSKNNQSHIQLHADTKRKKLAFFTPLPPIKSGIADYSVDVLNKLSKDFEIDVFIDKNYTPDVKFISEIRIFSYDKFADMKEQYDEIVFQMGNSEYHIYMIKYIQECAGEKGVLVLHDANLHGLVYFMAQQNNDSDFYRNVLIHDYNEHLVNEYISDLNSGKTHLKIYEMPCNGFVTKYVRKIIVHSDYAKKQLLNKDIGLSVAKIPHYAKINELHDKDSARTKLNIPLDSIVLASFGHIHESKRIMPIVKAFHEMSKGNDRLRLYLVGKPAESIKNELYDYINHNDLTGKVVVTGFVDLESFEMYIDAADICLNLRYPYNGESSGSLARILAKGKCVIVNDLGSFSEIPDNSCVKLPSPELLDIEEEVKLIIREVNNLLSDCDRIKSIKINAREFAEKELNLNHVANLYRKVILNHYSSKDINEHLINSIGKFLNDCGEEDLYRLAQTLAFIKQEGGQH
jgi:glycosyltransferase involved in cell wall biosynthesis